VAGGAAVALPPPRRPHRLPQAHRTTAAAWPSKPIRVVVGFAPGGSTDVMARILAQSLTESLGQTVLIDNKPGASGNISATEVVRAAPDGHTFLIAPTSVETANPSLFKSTLLPSRDLTPVATVGRTQMYLVAKPQLPAKDVRELVALAKAKPGTFSYASPARARRRTWPANSSSRPPAPTCSTCPTAAPRPRCRTCSRARPTSCATRASRFRTSAPARPGCWAS
jgi:hypothetical protein